MLNFIIKLISRFYKYKNDSFLYSVFSTYYSRWASFSFKKVGKNFFSEYKFNLQGLEYFHIGDNFHSLSGLRMECWDQYSGELFTPKLIIGNNVVMNYNVHIGCINLIKIGNNVLFASDIFITDHFHGEINHEQLDIPPLNRKLFSKGPVIIEDNVWIGEKVSIMPNVTIGKGSIIGANSVVTKSFPEYSIIAGVPAKLVNKAP